MIAQSTSRSSARAIGLAPWAATAAALAGLAAIVLARWAATRAGLDPLGVGAAFGVGLAALWIGLHVLIGEVAIGRSSRGLADARRTALGLAAGLVFGLALVGLAVVGAWLAGLQLAPGTLRPAAPFLPWMTVTVFVAAAEEGILRGVLFDRLRSSGGVILALAATAVVFSLMHVPVYGLGIVPLDLAVGVALGGLRLATGTLLAPIVAHAVADLATWWL